MVAFVHFGPKSAVDGGNSCRLWLLLQEGDQRRPARARERRRSGGRIPISLILLLLDLGGNRRQVLLLLLPVAQTIRSREPGHDRWDLRRHLGGDDCGSQGM